MKGQTFHERKAHRTQYYLRFVHGWKQRVCSACAGSGRYDASGSPTCSACAGSGRERFKPERTVEQRMTDAQPNYRMNALQYLHWHESEGYINGMSVRARRESAERAAKYGKSRLGDVPDDELSLKDYCAAHVRPRGVGRLIAAREYPLSVAVEDWIAIRRDARPSKQVESVH